MSVPVTPAEGPVLVIADPHWDSYAAQGLDPLIDNGIDGLIGARSAAVIAAGDLVSNARVSLAPALLWLRKTFAPAPIFYFPGNHDFYHAGIEADPRLRQITQSAGAIYAQMLELIHTGNRYLCATLWTDFDLGGDAARAMWQAKASMLDYRRISMPPAWETGEIASNTTVAVGQPRLAVTPEALRRLHFTQRNWIAERLAEPFAGRSIVVGHHAPHPAVLGALSGLSPAFGSDLTDLIQRHAPAVWFFGHTHRRLTATVGATEIRNVSIGYPSEAPTPPAHSLFRVA